MRQVEFEHNGRRIGADLIRDHNAHGEIKGKVMVHIEGELVGLGQWVENETGCFIWCVHPQNGLKSTGLSDDDYTALSDALNRL